MDVLDLDQVALRGAGGSLGVGRLDILVNNAGLGPSNPAVDVTVEDFDLTVDVNLKGIFFASQAAARIMTSRDPAGSSTSAARPVSWRCPRSRCTA